MKFLVDAQLPRMIVSRLNTAGHDAVHTLNLPKRNRTSDEEILRIAARDERVVITKDADFIDSFSVKGQPERLLLISTGNITNKELEVLFLPNIAAIVVAFETNHLIELTRKALIVHS